MTRDTLTREQIVAAAIDLLDNLGLERFSMRTLGHHLDSAATAVYWHVGSKDTLIALASDHVWNEIALPDLAKVDWRTAAASMATELHDMLTRHLWLVQAFGSHMVYGPGKARHDEHSLAIYETAGFIGAQADQAASSVFIFVLGNALSHAAAASFARKFGRAGDDAMKLTQESMAKARTIAQQFPRLRARLETANPEYAEAPANTFEFGLQAILDGIAAQLPPRPAR